MATKKVPMSISPRAAAPSPDDWVNVRATSTAEAAPAKPASPGKVEATESAELKRLTVDMPAELHRALKLHAAQQGVQMAELVRRWITAGLEQK